MEDLTSMRLSMNGMHELHQQKILAKYTKRTNTRNGSKALEQSHSPHR